MCDFCFVEHAIFPNVGFLNTFEIIKGVFSKYFSKFCLKDQEYNVMNKTPTFLFCFIFQKVHESSFRIKVRVNQTFFSLSLIIWGIKIGSDYDEF